MDTLDSQPGTYGLGRRAFQAAIGCDVLIALRQTPAGSTAFPFRHALYAFCIPVCSLSLETALGCQGKSTWESVVAALHPAGEQGLWEATVTCRCCRRSPSRDLFSGFQWHGLWAWTISLQDNAGTRLSVFVTRDS